MTYQDDLWRRVEAEQLYGYDTMKGLGEDQASFMSRHAIEQACTDLPDDALESEYELLQTMRWDLMDELKSVQTALAGIANVLKDRRNGKAQ